MGGPVDDDMANLLVAQLLYLDSANAEKDITMYVNSPGGSVTAGEHHVTQRYHQAAVPAAAPAAAAAAAAAPAPQSKLAACKGMGVGSITTASASQPVSLLQ